MFKERTAGARMDMYLNMEKELSSVVSINQHVYAYI